MTDALELGIALALLLFATMYFGTGWSLVLFLFPIAPALGPATYRVPFVGPVEAATRFFTPMTIAMLVAAVALLILELGSALVLVPAAYLAALVAATALTQARLKPINARMAAGIEDPHELQRLLAGWRRLNLVRTSLWSVEWVAMAVWFGVRAA